MVITCRLPLHYQLNGIAYHCSVTSAWFSMNAHINRSWSWNQLALHLAMAPPTALVDWLQRQAKYRYKGGFEHPLDSKAKPSSKSRPARQPVFTPIAGTSKKTARKANVNGLMQITELARNEHLGIFQKARVSNQTIMPRQTSLPADLANLSFPTVVDTELKQADGTRVVSERASVASEHALEFPMPMCPFQPISKDTDEVQQLDTASDDIEFPDDVKFKLFDLSLESNHEMPSQREQSNINNISDADRYNLENCNEMLNSDRVMSQSRESSYQQSLLEQSATIFRPHMLY